MPSTHQSGGRTGETYRNEYERMVATKPDHLLLMIEPMSEAEAREWLGACNTVSANEKVVKHFAEAVKRLSE